MNKLMLAVCGLAAVVLLSTGCKVLVPQTRLTVDLKKEKVTYSSPKDLGITNLLVEVRTNGTFAASISNLTAATSAEVVKQTGEGQATTAKGIGSMLKDGGTGIKTAADGVSGVVNPVSNALKPGEEKK